MGRMSGFHGGKLYADVADILGDLVVGGSLTVVGETVTTETIGTLTVTGAATVGTTLGVTGAVTHSSTSHFVGAVTADAALTVGTTLGVTGAATLSSTLHVVGALTADAAVTVGTTLGVTGASTLASAVVTAALTAGTLAVGGGTVIKKITVGAFTLDLASIGAAQEAEQSVTVTGVAVGDMVYVAGPDAGLSVAVVITAAYVSGTDTVKFRVLNPTAGSLDAASASFRYIWIDVT